MSRKDLETHETEQPLEKLKDKTRSHTSCLEAILRSTDPVQQIKDRLIHTSRNFADALEKEQI